MILKRGTITTKGDNGKEYSGYFTFDNEGLLIVTYKNESEKSFEHPTSNPEPKARIMLANIIKTKVLKK